MIRNLMIGLASTGLFLGSTSPLHSATKSTDLNISSVTSGKYYIAASAKKADGSFQDAQLEAAYQAYLVRKKNSSTKAKFRDEWEEARNYWLFDSPIARGNAFNKKRAPFYKCNEVNLANQKRLDSYVEDKEIISRKATDFDDIEESTFRQYVSELKNKYAVGTVIRSNTCPSADGKKLQGAYILEVPDTNQNAAVKTSFTTIAASNQVTIKYVPE